VSILRLPLSAIVIATLLTAKSGSGAEPLTIVGVVAAYLMTLRLSAPGVAQSPTPDGVTGAAVAPATAVTR
jgi:hypothetical protein